MNSLQHKSLCRSSFQIRLKILRVPTLMARGLAASVQPIAIVNYFKHNGRSYSMMNF
jgi:hypothetical protein